ncbi:ATP-binding protein [Parafilimonas sp.]|uniref:tetratricopeptide repeat-containing sensor histidine kinase n=1 Tax=Parafilimonas sp. TaxID=1969739 RepID=UPI0039E57E59
MDFYSGIAMNCNMLATCWFTKNNDSALYYGRLARFYATQANTDYELLLKIHSNLIQIYIEFAMYDSALHAGRKAISIIDAWSGAKREKKERFMHLYAAMGRIYFHISSYDSSAIYYSKAIVLGEKLGSYYYLSNYYNNLGTVCAANNELYKAIGWAKKSIVACKRENDLAYLIFVYASIASHYEILGNYELAKRYVDSSIHLAYASDTIRLPGMSYRVLGDIEAHYKNYTAALEYYQKGFAIENRKSGNERNRLNFRRKFAGIYLLLNNLPLAEKTYTEIIQLAGANNELKANAYMGLSEVYQKQGNYMEAYNALTKAKKLYDEIFNVQKNKTLQDLNIKYEAENKEKQLLLLENEKLLQRQQIDRQSGELTVRSLMLKERERTIEIARLEADRQRQMMMIQELTLTKNRNDLQQQQLALSGANQQLQVEQQEKALQQANYSRQKNRFILAIVAVLATVIILALYYNRRQLKARAASQQALLQERLRISRELHDEVGATLSGVVMYSHFTRDQVRASNITGVEHSLSIMQQSSEEMVQKLNEIVWLVSPEKDTLQKLVQRLEEYARKMAAIKGMKVQFNLPQSLPGSGIGFERRRTVYLICKEAINNAVKYSGASQLSFHVKITDEKLLITIKDNGGGFDTGREYTGNGLVNMKNRAGEINGSLFIQSSEKGTCISFECDIK